MSQTVIQHLSTQTYKQAKECHKIQSLESAVEWAKALKCLKAEKKASNFQLNYMKKIMSVFSVVIKKATDDEIKHLFEHIGSKKQFVGKSELIDGKPYQPMITFAKFEDGFPSDYPLANIGMVKHKYIQKQICNLNDEIEELNRAEELLIAKQKFYRYSYNKDIENMMLEHQKISEFESSQLQDVMEADADGTGGKVVFHTDEWRRGEEGELSDMEIGMRQKEYAEQNTQKCNGNYIRVYGERIKHAYEIREGIIKTATMLKEATPLQKKYGQYTVSEIQTRTAEGSIPNLF